MKLRIPTITLLVAIVVSCASCGDVTDSIVTEATEPQQTSEVVRTPYIEKNDYGGAVFTVFAPEWGGYVDYMFAEEQTGDAMNDALYERERLVEEYLGVNIEYLLEGTISETSSKVNSVVMSGDDTYQLVLTHCISQTADMVSKGLLIDWNDIDTVDLTREYWNQHCNDGLTVYGRQYYAVNDFMIPDPNAIIFNKEMIENYSLDDPYQLVYDGTWTLDKMFEMSAAVTNDLNGDSIYDVNDQYGFAAEGDWMLCSFLYSSGIRLTEKSDDGGLELVLNNDRMYSLVDKLDTFINRSNSAYLWKYGAAAEEQLDMHSGRILFRLIGVKGVKNYRDCEVEFGILPYPKYEESQTEYNTNDWSGLMCVPITAGDADMIGEVCEMLAFYSADTTLPAYYDVVLGEKLARDDDSRKILDIIFDGIVYDAGSNFLGQTNNMFNLYYTIPFMIFRDGSGDFASWYGKYENGAIQELTNLLDDIKGE